jgi:predicted enzyme related to lactoylglutathione lyase
MPIRTSATPGAPTWVDLSTGDAAGARSFYCDLFGWTADEPNEEFGGYFMFNRDGVPIAGGMAKQAEQMPDTWSIYLASEDIEKTVSSAAAEGATVVVPVMAVGDTGSMAYLIDPSGAGIGVWQPKEFFGFTTYAEIAAPAWWELMTKDFATTISFYRSVFGWETAVIGDSDEFRYSVAMDGENQACGVMDAAGFLPEGVPSYWSVYFAVADADAALARVQELGGSVLEPAQDTPYGRLATAADPSGARFKLLGPNAPAPTG